VEEGKTLESKESVLNYTDIITNKVPGMELAVRL